MKKYLYLLIIFCVIGCKGDAELAMERGIQYYEWDKIEKSILEFKYVIHNISLEKANYKQILLLSRAHHNLAIAYAKNTWYNEAIKEAKKAFELIPTEDNKKIIELIEKKMSNENKKTNP